VSELAFAVAGGGTALVLTGIFLAGYRAGHANGRLEVSREWLQTIREGVSLSVEIDPDLTDDTDTDGDGNVPHAHPWERN
jgi:hypothetical protein